VANVTVNVGANRRPINPNVYGLAYGSAAQLIDLNVPLDRYGGNNTSRYNWQVNGDNRGQDWYFESIGRQQQRSGRARQHVHREQPCGRRAGYDHDSADRLGSEGLDESIQAGHFSQAKYGSRPGMTGSGFPDAGNESWHPLGSQW